MRVRQALFLMPIIIGAFFLLSFLVARENFDRKVNQLILSSIGDAEKLNPVLSTDSASSDINSLVFNGLVKYNENQELAPDLAERWEVEQTSTIYLQASSGLTSDEASRNLRRALGPEGMERLKIEAIAPQGNEALKIHLKTAGRAFEEETLRLLPQKALEPIVTLFVYLDTKRKFPDGEEVGANSFLKRYLKALGLRPELKERSLEQFIENSSLLALKLRGEDGPFMGLLEGLLRGGRPSGKEKAPEVLGRVVKVERAHVDNEPVITFYLRKGVRWHDGEPFTARDVAFTYEKIMDERTNTVRRPLFELVKRLEVLDAHTVRVIYKKPFSPALEAWGMGIIPEHLFRGHDINTSPLNRRPIGTGPFIFKEWVSDERITLVANPDYFEGRPHLDQISYRIIPEPPLKELEFFTGGVDLDNPQPYQYKRYSSDPRFRLYSRLSNGYTYIGWNQKVDLFKDVRVRRALTHAIDRKRIVKFLLYDLGVIATGPFPPQMWYSNPEVKPLEYDPEKARELLREAGWRDTDGDGILDKDGRPFKFSLITNNGNKVRENVAVLVQRQLRELGIQVDVELYEWSVFIRDKINARNYEATVLGWSLGFDPDIYEIWHSSQIEKGFNFTAYSNPEVDRLIEEGRTEFDREKRRKIYWKIHELINRDQPYIFLFVGEGTLALHRGEFKIKRSVNGRTVVEDIEMTEVGLTYFLNFWFRVRGHTLTT